MITDDERREVARRLRECRGGWSSGECYYTIIHALGLPDTSREDGGAALYARLADLIEPSCDAAATHTDASATCDMSQSRRDNVACDPTVRGIDSIYEWCFSGLEGADGDEDYLYCTIMSAIEEYRHPERVTARTARAVDRDALLALADEMDAEGLNGWAGPVNVGEYARRIREACGVTADE